ncbi:MAG: hypothetical protein O7G85_01720 [Planctomycetota bacterium]|nr:hypothetical protein [Planctomycetota bacterium]
MWKLTLIWIVLFFLVVVGCFNSGSGRPSQEEVSPPAKIHISDPLRQKVSEAQVQFQEQFCKLLLSEAPRIRELVEINRDLQIAYIHRRDMRYEHFWSHDPERINMTDGHMEWLNWDWTEQDEQALFSDSSVYAQLQDRISELKGRNKEHPMWPEAREEFSRMKEDTRLKAIEERFQKVLEEIDRELQSR